MRDFQKVEAINYWHLSTVVDQIHRNANGFQRGFYYEIDTKYGWQ